MRTVGACHCKNISVSLLWRPKPTEPSCGAASSFDGETETERLARRQRNWIAEVEYVTPPDQNV